MRPGVPGVVPVLRVTRVLVAAASTVAIAAACGQKGALYLPKRGTVVTRPAGSGTPATSAPDKPDDKKDEDKPKP